MKEYLKMEDAFSHKVDPITDWDEHGHEVKWITLLLHQAEHAAHAINSHDELVQMNQEMLEALEVIAASEEFQGDSFVCDFETLQRVAHDAIAKVKGV